MSGSCQIMRSCHSVEVKTPNPSGACRLSRDFLLRPAMLADIFFFVFLEFIALLRATSVTCRLSSRLVWCHPQSARTDGLDEGLSLSWTDYDVRTVRLSSKATTSKHGTWSGTSQREWSDRHQRNGHPALPARPSVTKIFLLANENGWKVTKPPKLIILGYWWPKRGWYICHAHPRWLSGQTKQWKWNYCL